MQQQLIDQNIVLTKQIIELKKNTKDIDKNKTQAYVKKPGNTQETSKTCVIVDRLDNGDFMISGNTYDVKEVIKGMGGKWTTSPSKGWVISNPIELETIKSNLINEGCKVVVHCADWK